MRKFSSFLALAAVLFSANLSAGASDCNCPDFRVKDFEGCFAGYGSSIGGIGGVATPVQSSSVANLAQVKWDKNGCGTLGFLSVSIWSAAGVPKVYSNAVVASPNATNFNLATIIAKLKLIDPNTGAVVSSNSTGNGITEISDFPLSGDKSANEFVAFKKDGKVVKYVQITTFGELKGDGYETGLVSGPNTGVSLLISERQGQ
jgi:hypothetical protein